MTLTTVTCASTFDETVKALVAAIEQRGLTVFVRFDHAAGARDAGLELADEEVIVFGNPRAGTPLMREDPQVGIELPLRILVWQAGDDVLLGYRDPRSFASDYTLAEHTAILDAMGSLLADLVAEAAA